jgi:hypothetical protein
MPATRVRWYGGERPAEALPRPPRSSRRACALNMRELGCGLGAALAWRARGRPQLGSWVGGGCPVSTL